VPGKIIKPMLQFHDMIVKIAGDMSQLQVFHQCFIIIKLLNIFFDGITKFTKDRQA
jgi:hypothetical protein